MRAAHARHGRRRVARGPWRRCHSRSAVNAVGCWPCCVRSSVHRSVQRPRTRGDHQMSTARSGQAGTPFQWRGRDCRCEVARVGRGSEVERARRESDLRREGAGVQPAHQASSGVLRCRHVCVLRGCLRAVRRGVCVLGLGVGAVRTQKGMSKSLVNSGRVKSECEP